MDKTEPTTSKNMLAKSIKATNVFAIVSFYRNHNNNTRYPSKSNGPIHPIASSCLQKPKALRIFILE